MGRSRFALKEAILQRHARSREDLQFERNLGTAGLVNRQVKQRISGTANSRRQFPDREAFVAFCKAIYMATGSQGIAVRTGEGLPEVSHQPGVVAESILAEPPSTYEALGFELPDANNTVYLSSAVMRNSPVPPLGYAVEATLPDEGSIPTAAADAIEQAFLTYTRRVPLSAGWNPRKPYPLIENTARVNVAQRVWQNKVEIRAAMFGAAAGGGVSLIIFLLQNAH